MRMTSFLKMESHFAMCLELCIISVFPNNIGLIECWKWELPDWTLLKRKNLKIHINWDLKRIIKGAISRYIEWSSHEPEPGVYNFDGNLDIASYFETAQKFNLSIILRPGPFIDAEREMVTNTNYLPENLNSSSVPCYLLLLIQGGLPYWLMTVNPAMKLRSSDASKYIYLIPSRIHHKLPISPLCSYCRLCVICGALVFSFASHSQKSPLHQWRFHHYSASGKWIWKFSSLWQAIHYKLTGLCATTSG